MSTNKENDISGSLTDAVSEHYKKFFNKFGEMDTVLVSDWKPVHLLGYICKKYEEYYGVKYSWKFNNPAPSRSYEVLQIKKIANMLTSNPINLKEYIDWVFQYKIIEKKKRITSFAYFSHQDIINEYKFKFLLPDTKRVIKRTDRLPQNIVAMCARHEVNIHTYAELAFVKRMPNQSALLAALKEINFDINILDKIV